MRARSIRTLLRFCAPFRLLPLRTLLLLHHRTLCGQTLHRF